VGIRLRSGCRRVAEVEVVLGAGDGFPAPSGSLDGSDYPSHAAQEAAIASYIR
jgi:hypothetical protein